LVNLKVCSRITGKEGGRGYMTKKRSIDTFDPKDSNESIHFESALNELEGVIQKMETGQLSLEASLESFEKGISLARLCQEALKTAEQKVQLLTEQNGTIKAEPFLVED